MLPKFNPERRQREIELSNLIAVNLFTWRRIKDRWVDDDLTIRYAVAGSDLLQERWFFPAHNLDQAHTVLVLMSLICYPLDATWLAMKDEFTVEDASRSMAICRLAEMLINRDRVPAWGQKELEHANV